MRLILKILLSCMLLNSCHDSNQDTLIIGTISGPETDLVRKAADIGAEKFGLKTKIVEFNDYNLPNEALNEGSLDANIYQHLPYLKMAKKMRHYKITPLGKTFLYPMGLYSRRYTKMSALPEGAVIAIPNDPSNEARALLLLEKAHYIELTHKNTSSLHDISANPHHFQFKAMDAAQLPRILPDVDAAVINTTFALPAGLSPTQDALLLENTDSPYVNLMVIHENAPKKEKLEQFLEAYHSKEVKTEAEKIFKNAAIPAW
jgi:D-methionine transport system substrate-binding protein